MERSKLFQETNFVTSFEATKILGVNSMTLIDLIRHGVVKPPHVPRSNGKNHWGPREIFRAFLSLHLIEEYKTKYGSKNSHYMYDQIKRDLLSTERTRGREFLESAEWKDVTTRATERGLYLLDLQEIKFNRGLPAED
jgi:hypothetical protein